MRLGVELRCQHRTWRGVCRKCASMYVALMVAEALGRGIVTVARFYAKKGWQTFFVHLVLITSLIAWLLH